MFLLRPARKDEFITAPTWYKAPEPKADIKELFPIKKKTRYSVEWYLEAVGQSGTT